MPDPAVSLVVCAYRRPTSLDVALATARAQTQVDFEIIVVDDSGDSSCDEVLRHHALDARVSVVRPAHQGLAGARSRGVALARAPWVTFLDDDDTLLPHHLASRVQLHQRYPKVQFWQGGVRCIGEQSVPDFFDRSRLIDVEQVVVGATFFLERDLFESLGGFTPIAFGDDTDLWHRAKGKCIMGQIREPRTYEWRRSGGTMSDVALQIRPSE